MPPDRTQSLLDALQSPAAVIDKNGRIEAVNAVWARSRQTHALDGERFVVGADFTALCADTPDGGGAAALVAGLRDIWAGRSQTFTHGYSTGEGDTKQSFEVAVSAIAGTDGPDTLVVQHDVTERERLVAAKNKLAEDMRLVLELLPEGYWEYDIKTGHVYYSDRWLQSLGYEIGDIKPNAQSWIDLLHPDDKEQVMEACFGYIEGRYPSYQAETRLRMKDGRWRWNIDRCRIVARDAEGKATRILGMEIDITERKLAEMKLEEQSKRMMDLSTPLIPISDRVVVMPLIGAVDATRAEQVLSSLLNGLSHNRAQVAILDITGVSLIDSHVAAVLVNAARAVQLLGAEVVLTGVRPEVATILVGLGIDLGKIIVRGTLQSGITYATGSEQRNRAS